MKKLLVWDLPVRLSHWSMMILIVSAIITGELGDDLIEQHALIGYAVLALLIFRLSWGLVGGKYSRIMTYRYHPKLLFLYLRGKFQPALGYSPIGLLAVTCLFSLIWTQALSGLVSTDDMMFEGPLRHLVGAAWSDKLTAIHKFVGPVLIAFLVLHLNSILFYKLVLKENKVHAMLFGYKEVPNDTPDELAGTHGRPIWAIGLLIISLTSVWYIVNKL